MYIYVYVCIYISVYIYIFIYINTYARIYMNMYMLIYVCLRAYIYILGEEIATCPSCTLRIKVIYDEELLPISVLMEQENENDVIISELIE
jgi:hypothetical protein